MKSPDNFRLLISPEKMHVAGALWVKYAIAIVFIALIALFATAPVGEMPSAYDKPLPMPAEMGLEPPAAEPPN